MDISKIFQTKAFKMTLYTIGVIVILLVFFQAGLLVGFKKADFSCRWGENYQRNFIGPEMGMRLPGLDGGRPNPHGTAGQIIKVELPNIIVEGLEGLEKIVKITDQTKIRKFDKLATSTDLQLNDHVVIIGEPNEQGQIEAKLIRVLPLPGDFLPAAPEVKK
ncbi:MAG: hypothetical protein WCW02_04250 [Candidatus Buchananbacteria bacterium]